MQCWCWDCKRITALDGSHDKRWRAFSFPLSLSFSQCKCVLSFPFFCCPMLRAGTYRKLKQLLGLFTNTKRSQQKRHWKSGKSVQSMQTVAHSKGEENVFGKTSSTELTVKSQQGFTTGKRSKSNTSFDCKHPWTLTHLFPFKAFLRANIVQKGLFVGFSRESTFLYSTRFSSQQFRADE